ncbi:MAG: nitroreductase family protein [Planctomycetia bacterium]|nr:nitroreductase family protein [Planctomycetia bacterium]
MPLPTIQVNSDQCIRCGLCLKDCLAKLLAFGDDGLPAYVPGGAARCFRCQHCMAVCPQGALSWSGKNPEDSPLLGTVCSPETLQNLLYQRRSIRSYLRKNVESEKFARLREAMAFVPTGCNDHRLFFACSDDLAVTDMFREAARKAVLEKIASGTLPGQIAHFANMKPALDAGVDIYFRNAPHFVAIAVPPDAKDAHIDPYIAATQFELLAGSMGLGTCWGGMATDLFLAIPELQENLDLPDGVDLKIVMLFGYPSVKYARIPQPEPCGWVSLKSF